MMSLVRMALLLLSSWLVCHTFVSTIPPVSSATRLYGRRESSADRDRRDAVPLEDDFSSRIHADYQSDSLPLLQELSAGQLGSRLVFIRPPLTNRPLPTWDPPRLLNLSATISPPTENSDEAPFNRPSSRRHLPTWEYPFRQTVQVREAGGDMDTQGNTDTQDNRSPPQFLQLRSGSFPESVIGQVGRLRFTDPRRISRHPPYWDHPRTGSTTTMPPV